MKLLIINGPNLNLLGTREKHIYGGTTYKEMCEYLHEKAKEVDIEIDILQSNVEGEIINYIQGAMGKYQGIIINPAAYTHYSIAIYDALMAVDIKTVEVHISNIHSREEYRRKSITAPACIGQLCGFGIYGYVMAMQAFKNLEN